MHYRDALILSLKALAYALGSAMSALAAFMERSLPLIQWIAAAAATVAAIASIRASIASSNAIKKGNREP